MCIRDSQDIAFDLPKKISAIAYSDSQKITQIIYNLTDNALKNSEGKEPIIFQAKLVKNENDTAHLWFTIKDTVTNLSEKELSRIKEAEKLLEVYSEDVSDEGQKDLLNMAMVSKLTKILDGRLTVENQSEGGIEYKIIFPVRLAKTTPFTTGTRPDAPIKILLVCLLYTSPSPRDATLSRMPSSA